MLRVAGIAGFALIAVIGCSNPSPPGPSSTPTTVNPATSPVSSPCGASEQNGAKVHTWCGPGSISLTVAGKTSQITQAICDTATRRGLFAFSAGTTADSAEGASMITANGFSLYVPGVPPTLDGTYTQALFGGNLSGVGFVAEETTKKTVTLTNRGTKGTFKGVDDNRTEVSGTFNCN